MHPNAIYNNNVLVGFFMYRRAESRADTAVLRRFMIDAQFQRRGLGKKTFAHVLPGDKDDGEKALRVSCNNGDVDIAFANGN